MPPTGRIRGRSHSRDLGDHIPELPSQFGFVDDLAGGSDAYEGSSDAIVVRLRARWGAGIAQKIILM